MNKYNHPAYGLIQFNKINGNSSCFMSDINLGGYIELVVKRSEVERKWGRYTLHPIENIIRLKLSYHQFSELITNMNSNVGVACTLQYVKGEENIESYESPPDARSQFELEMQSILKDSLNKLAELSDQLTKLKEKDKISKKDLTELSNLVDRVSVQLNQNAPYLEECFVEALDKKVADAKIETSAWIEHKLSSLGLESLSKELPQGE